MCQREPSDTSLVFPSHPLSKPTALTLTDCRDYSHAIAHRPQYQQQRLTMVPRDDAGMQLTLHGWCHAGRELTAERRHYRGPSVGPKTRFARRFESPAGGRSESRIGCDNTTILASSPRRDSLLVTEQTFGHFAHHRVGGVEHIPKIVFDALTKERAG